MRLHLQELYNKFFGQDIFIIGGGYSVKSINIDYLYDKNVIAINDAFDRFPNATALFWCDESWAARNYHKFKNHKSDLRFVSKTYGSGHIKNDIKTFGGATVLLNTGEYGYDPLIDNVRGNNSGTEALNLVVNTKPKKIYLIGFDMRDNPEKRGETHFHNNHILVVKPEIYKTQFIPSIISLAKEVRKLYPTLEIINCSKTSAIPCFPKKIISELML
jgi:hypothetical protein